MIPPQPNMVIRWTWERLWPPACHTVTTSRSVERFHGRIAVDTGTYDTSILSALHIRPDGSESVLQAASDNRSMVTVMVGRILDIGHQEAAPSLQGRARNA